MNEPVQDAQSLSVVCQSVVRPAQTVATTHNTLSALAHLAATQARFAKPRTAGLCQSPHQAIMDKLEAAR